MVAPVFELAPRAGVRPRTTPANPHTQLDQQPTNPAIVAELAHRAFSLPDAEERPSRPRVRPPASSPRSQPAPVLPPDAVEAVVARRWGELHPVARRGLIAVTALLFASYHFAGGRPHRRRRWVLPDQGSS